MGIGSPMRARNCVTPQACIVISDKSGFAIKHICLFVHLELVQSRKNIFLSLIVSHSSHISASCALRIIREAYNQDICMAEARYHRLITLRNFQKKTSLKFHDKISTLPIFCVEEIKINLLNGAENLFKFELINVVKLIRCMNKLAHYTIFRWSIFFC